VLTNHPPDDEADPSITFLSGDIRTAVATGLDAAAGKNLLVLGANVTDQCLDEGLVDEILIFLYPLLLGDGVRLFDSLAGRINLDPTVITRSGPIANLRYRVVK
jgi:dihydrofolate reductase